MTYEIYKKLLFKDQYFDTWESKDLIRLSNGLREQIYEKYVVKTLVFQRDNFTCQNENCTYCKNEYEFPNLTMHHVKWKKNGGQDKLKNGVTLCLACHKNFHQGKCSLQFWGNIYKIDDMTENGTKVNWKKIKFESKQLRKNITLDDKGVRISLNMLLQLMKFLQYEYQDLFDEDEDNNGS